MNGFVKRCHTKPWLKLLQLGYLENRNIQHFKCQVILQSLGTPTLPVSSGMKWGYIGVTHSLRPHLQDLDVPFLLPVYLKSA